MKKNTEKNLQALLLLGPGVVGFLLVVLDDILGR